MVLKHIEENQLSAHFARAGDKQLTKEDKIFILKIMRLDPRDRPTARQLLDDEWFKQQP